MIERSTYPLVREDVVTVDEGNRARGDEQDRKADRHKLSRPPAPGPARWTAQERQRSAEHHCGEGELVQEDARDVESDGHRLPGSTAALGLKPS